MGRNPTTRDDAKTDQILGERAAHQHSWLQTDRFECALCFVIRIDPELVGGDSLVFEHPPCPSSNMWRSYFCALCGARSWRQD